MKKLEKTKIEYIKEFLKTKGYIWKGVIRDPLRITFRHAELEDFRNRKMVRLMVSTPTNKKDFEQRVIVSDSIFRIENTNLKRMDNFENFSAEWLEFLNSKTINTEEIIKES